MVCALLMLPLALSPAAAKPRESAPRHEFAGVASAVPTNDDFANAQALTGTSETVMGTNIGATKEFGEPDHAGDSGGASVWYTWTPATTVLALFSTGGSDFDTLLAVYTGNSVSALTEITSDDDYGSLQSQVTFVAHAGTTYRIAVDGYGGDEGDIVLSFATSASTYPLITSADTATAVVGQAFSYQIVATNNPLSYASNGLPAGLTLNPRTGLITGTETSANIGQYNAIIGATNASGTSQASLTLTVSTTPAHPAFFNDENALSNGVYFLQFPFGNYFGYYSYLTNSNYIYHFDLGYEYVFDADDNNSGVYLYDFASNDFFYTSPSFPFPYLYDFNLNSTVYYYPDPNNYGHYNTNGVRYFYVFNTGQIISK